MTATSPTGLRLRAATPADVAGLTALARAEDVGWWGEPDTDEDEIAEDLAAIDDLAGWTRVVEAADGGLLGWAARLRREEGTLRIRPTLGADRSRLVEEALLTWLVEVGVLELDAPEHDRRRLDALRRHGYEPIAVQVELVRPRQPTPVGPPPAGYRDRPVDPDLDAAEIHHLVYDAAGWSRVPGHHHRPLPEWRRLFLGGVGFDPDLQVAAWHGPEPAGVALCRVYGGTHGWVAQLAVADAHRRRGLGRWLLAEATRRLSLVPDVEQVGLAVFTANEGALALYRAVGFEPDRRWVLARRPPPPVAQQTRRSSG